MPSLGIEGVLPVLTDEHPITHSEMLSILHPLQSCLLRMESTLLALSATPLQLQPVDENDLTNLKFLGSTIEIANGSPSGAVDAGSCMGFANGSSSGAVDAIPSTALPPIPEDGIAISAVPQEAAPAADAFPQSNDSAATVPKLKKRGSTVSCYDQVSHKGSTEKMNIHRELQQINFGRDVGLVQRLFTGALEYTVDVWSSIEEPERTGCMHRIASNHTFQSVCMLVIMFNSILVAYTADWQIQNVGATQPSFFSLLELSCLIFFSIELFVRIAAHRCYFFVNSDMHWNIFDFLLVSISLIDVVFEQIIGASSGSNVGFMRLLRLLKLARIFRSLRSFRFFKSLAVLLESFQKSFASLFWGFIMLSFVLYLFSLIFMQALLEYLTQDDVDPSFRQQIHDDFGSLANTLITLYMAVSGGNDWKNYYEIIRQCAGTPYALVFVMYTFVLNFAIFNILTGSLVEKAMTSSKPDRADLILNQRRVFAEQRQQFVDLCRAMDKDGDDMISWDEFEQCMCNSTGLAYMASIGIEVSDVELFFQTLAKSDSGEGGGIEEVPIETFVEGCMHMKGNATALDMQRALYEMCLVNKELQSIKGLMTRSNRIDSRLVKVERFLAQGTYAPSQLLRPGVKQILSL